MEGLKFSPILIEYSLIKSNGTQQKIKNAGYSFQQSKN